VGKGTGVNTTLGQERKPYTAGGDHKEKGRKDHTETSSARTITQEEKEKNNNESSTSRRGIAPEASKKEELKNLDARR